MSGPVVDAGVLVLPAGAAHGITTTAATDGVPGEASLEIRVAVTRPDSDPVPYDGGPFYYWLGFQHEGDFAADRPWSLFVARGKSTIQAEHATTSGTCSSGCGSGSTLQSTESRIYRVDRWSGGVRFVLDDGTPFDAAGSSGDLSIMIRSFLAQSDVVVSWVRARPIVWPEPAVAIGPEKAL